MAYAFVRHVQLVWPQPCPALLQEVPEAAALLASEDNAKRDVPQLSALAYWAPSRLLQATALLTGAAGGHQAVRAYALRSLTTMATPEEVRAGSDSGAALLLVYV